MVFKKKRRFGAITTLIDKDITIKGNTTYSGGLRLDGKITGDLTVLGDAGGTLIMGEESRIIGNVMIETGIINGEITGNIKCLDYLELNANSVIKGDIEYSTIEIHAGAKINGVLLLKKEPTRQKCKLTLKEKIVKKMSRPNKKIKD